MSRGLIIAVPEVYQDICLQNLQKLRHEFRNDVRVEIWQIGNEITPECIVHYRELSNVTFRNVESDHWRGFQIKAYILKHTDFDEVLLCDADITFHQDPTVLFSDPGYLQTGTYFFRDLEKWKFSDLREDGCKYHSIDFYRQRRRFILGLLPRRSPLFPPEWSYLYSDDYPDHPVPEAYQESGVVAIDRQRNADVVQIIFDLNDRHEHTYRFIYGDKETFWLACVKADKPFTINPTAGYFCNKLVSQDYQGRLFYAQK